jgi:hypothetical protein
LNVSFNKQAILLFSCTWSPPSLIKEEKEREEEKEKEEIDPSG